MMKKITIKQVEKKIGELIEILEKEKKTASEKINNLDINYKQWQGLWCEADNVIILLKDMFYEKEEK